MITRLLITRWVGEDERKKDENPLHGVNILVVSPLLDHLNGGGDYGYDEWTMVQKH